MKIGHNILEVIVTRELFIFNVQEIAKEYSTG